MPDRFIEHGDYRDQLNLAGLTPGHIASTALQVGVTSPGFKAPGYRSQTSAAVQCILILSLNIVIADHGLGLGLANWLDAQSICLFACLHNHCLPRTCLQVLGRKEDAAKYAISNTGLVTA